MNDIAQGQDAVTADAVVTGAVDDAVLERAYGAVTAAPLQARAPAGASADKGDLVVVAIHERPAGTTDAQEIALATAGHWSPSTKDFLAVAWTGPRGSASVPLCGNVGEFLQAILEQPEQSLSRVVILSHSSEGVLGFGGWIDASGATMITASGGMADPLRGGVDSDAIDGLKATAQPLLQDVRKRWRNGRGEILFFSCGSGAGVNVARMQEFAQLLGARARGFSGPVGYCMDHDGKRVIQRGRTTLSFKTVDDVDIPDCASAQPGYRHLQPNKP